MSSPSGRLAYDRTEEAWSKMSYLQVLSGGKWSTMGGVIETMWADRPAVAARLENVQRTTSSVIGHVDLSLRYAHLRIGKMAGPSLLPPALY